MGAWIVFILDAFATSCALAAWLFDGSVIALLAFLVCAVSTAIAAWPAVGAFLHPHET